MALVLSLFPGIGMLDRALEEEGFCVVRGPDVLWGGDVRKFFPPPGRFDGVIGGPPCQSFSALANLVRARGYEPRFGNLIPEFERCVRAARPAWFLMENVPAAPVPVVDGYGIHSFILDNCALDSGDGYGQEQERKRRISFGLLGREAIDLRRWLEPATFLLPRRHSAVLGDTRETPVALGGSGKPKRTLERTVTKLGTDHLANLAASTQRVRSGAVSAAHQGEGQGRRRTGAVSSSDGSATGMNPMRRYRLAEACRLQGLPEDFLSDAPFTADAKLKAVANGVPIPMGRAVARAVKEALAPRQELAS